MSRTTRAELEELAALINSRLGGGDYAIGYAYGSPRLERDGGAVDVSPRLPAGQLADWMRAFLAGIDAMLRKAEDVALSCLCPFTHMHPRHLTGESILDQPLPDTGAGSQVEAYRG